MQGLTEKSKMATLCSSIHYLREGIGAADKETQAIAASTCDLWSVAVIYYFLRCGCWPFSKAQIGLWPQTPVTKWQDDGLVQYTRASSDPSM